MASQIESLCLCSLYIALSVVLINFNKFMMDATRFPFAVTLTMLHATNTLISCLALYKMAPSLFPSVPQTEGKRGKLLLYFLPLSGLFVLGVVCSNQAYLYCSVAFLQIMKQTNVVWVFCLCCLAGTQVPDRMKLTIIAIIVGGSMMGVHGELHFVMQGFIIQVLSQAGECGRNVLQEWILSGSDVKLDPLTYNLFVAPFSIVMLMIANWLTWDYEAPKQFLLWWHYLLPNAMCAFALNVSISTLIKHTSAMTFILCGIVKDILIVVSSAYMFGDRLSAQQVFGFSLTTTGILLWSLAKLYPASPLVHQVSTLLGMPSPEKAKEKENAREEEMQGLLEEESVPGEDDKTL